MASRAEIGCRRQPGSAGAAGRVSWRARLGATLRAGALLVGVLAASAPFARPSRAQPREPHPVAAPAPAGADAADPDATSVDPDPARAGPELRAQEQPQPVAGASDVDAWETIDFYWKDGVNYRVRPLHAAPAPISRYERFLALEGRVGMKLAVDAAGFDANGSLPALDATAELRRFFLYTTGKFRLVVPLVFKLEAGVVDDEPYLDNFYVGATDVPYAGSVRLGQFDAPMSLDLLTGSTYRTFMESPAPVQALAPGQKAGVQVASFSDRYRLSWQAGIFTDGQRQDVGDATRDVVRLVGRLVWRDVVGPPVSRLAHLGLSSSYVLSSSDRVRYRSRPESFLAPVLVDTGDLDAENVLLAGAEVAARDGPTSVQGELMASFVRSREVGDPTLYGGYVEVARTLTGEPRIYERAVGVFGRLTPRHDFDPRQGTWGAFEVAARVSGVDLNDAGARGGRMALLGGAFNWYWNRYVRLMFGYELAFVRGAERTGNLQVFQGRVQVVL